MKSESYSGTGIEKFRLVKVYTGEKCITVNVFIILSANT